MGEVTNLPKLDSKFVKRWAGLLSILFIFSYGAIVYLDPPDFRNYSEDSTYYTIIDNKTIDVYIGDGIASPSAYSKLVAFLKNYRGEKEIKIILNTPGGLVSSGEQIINAIYLAEARGVKVTAVVDTFALSMGAILALATSTTEIMPNSLLMFHNVSVGALAVPIPLQLHFNRFLSRISRGFLTDQELLAVREGKAVWVSDREAIRRLCELDRLAGTKEHTDTICAISKTWAPEETIFEQ